MDMCSQGRGRTLRGSALLAAVFLSITSGGAVGETLYDALAAAYSSNPTLLAQQAQLRAADERLPEVRSGWLPTVAATGQAGVSSVDSGAGAQDLNPLAYGLSVDQPLYQGGRTAAGTSQAENLILVERARLLSVEQATLLDAATAYMDVVRDLAVLALNVKTEQVLRREQSATEDRFRVGELTRTDVAQARARLAGAVAGRIQAQGNLEASRAAYVRIVGIPPETPVPPQPLEGLPATRGEFLSISESNNPDIVAAMHAEAAARDGIRIARSELLPTLSLNGDVEHREEFTGPGAETDSVSLVAQLRIPLYQGGGPSARVRGAKQVAGQRRIQAEEARRAVRAQATIAWEKLVTARARVSQFESQVEANRTALEGTREQARVGSRILLDVLNAEQELLDAEVSLVVAKRDNFVASLQVLASIGRLTARDLRLKADYYDETSYYRNVKGKLGGTGID